MVEGVDRQTDVSFVSIPLTALLWILGGDMRRFRHDDLQGNIWSPSWSLREDFFFFFGGVSRSWRNFPTKQQLYPIDFFCLFDRDVD